MQNPPFIVQLLKHAFHQPHRSHRLVCRVVDVRPLVDGHWFDGPWFATEFEFVAAGVEAHGLDAAGPVGDYDFADSFDGRCGEAEHANSVGHVEG